MTRAELIERLEAATGPDPLLDAAIGEHLGLTPASFRFKDGDQVSMWPNFTGSVDAAMTLVPAGWWVQHIGQNLKGWGVRIETQGCSIPNSMAIPRLATPALALCIAALKAGEAHPSSDGGGGS